MASKFYEFASDEEFQMERDMAEYAIECANIDRRLLLAESAYNVNIACADYKVLSEGGTYSDLEALYEAAEEAKKEEGKGVFESIRNAISAMFDKISNWFKNKKVQQLEKVCNENPKEANEGFKGFNLGKLSELWSKIKGFFGKIKGFLTGNKSEDEIGEEIEKEKKGIFGWIKNIFATVRVTITASGVCKAFKTAANEVPSLKETIMGMVSDAESKNKSKALAHIKGLGTWISEVTSTLWKNLKESLKNAPKPIRMALDFFKDLGDDVKNKHEENKAKREAKKQEKENTKNNNSGDNNQSNNASNSKPAEKPDDNSKPTGESVTLFGITLQPDELYLSESTNKDCEEILELMAKV